MDTQQNNESKKEANNKSREEANNKSREGANNKSREDANNKSREDANNESREEAKTLLKENTDQIINVLTKEVNAQISGLAVQISGLAVLVELLKHELLFLTERVTTVSDNVTTLTEEVTTFKSAISDNTPNLDNTSKSNIELLSRSDLKSMEDSINVQFAILKVLVSSNNTDGASVKPSILGTTKSEPKKRVTKKPIEVVPQAEAKAEVQIKDEDEVQMKDECEVEQTEAQKPKPKPRARATTTKTKTSVAKENSDFAISYMKNKDNLKELFQLVGKSEMLALFCNGMNISVSDMDQKLDDEQVEECCEYAKLNDSNMKEIVKSLNKIKKFKDFIVQAQKINSNKDSLNEDD